MSFSKGDVILLAYPFTDLQTSKVRPAVVVSSEDIRYSDVFVVPLTSRTATLNIGEFVLKDWNGAGLNVPSAVKRGCVLVSTKLVKMKVGTLAKRDIMALNRAIRLWFEL